MRKKSKLSGDIGSIFISFIISLALVSAIYWYADNPSVAYWENRYHNPSLTDLFMAMKQVIQSPTHIIIVSVIALFFELLESFSFTKHSKKIRRMEKRKKRF